MEVITIYNGNDTIHVFEALKRIKSKPTVMQVQVPLDSGRVIKVMTTDKSVLFKFVQLEDEEQVDFVDFLLEEVARLDLGNETFLVEPDPEEKENADWGSLFCGFTGDTLQIHTAR